jgi:uncharacterized protein (TIGR00296 family)
MIKEFTKNDGARFIELSRKAISYYLHTNALLLDLAPEKRFEKKRGVFVTLHEFPSLELRGCIGLPYPSNALWEAIIEAATSAAFSDPRFSELQASELDKIIVEVSVLTEPMEIKWKKEPEELLEKIVVGKDGLIMQQGGNSGLLLPQVATEWKWGVKEFLEQTCCKAGLPKDAWRDKETTIKKLQAQIFKENSPNSKEIIEE